LLLLDYYLSIGSNLEPERHVPAALRLLGTAGRIEAASAVYRTAPVGLADQPDFHNLAVRLRSALSPLFLLERCQAFERQVGRQRRQVWGPREIDLDLLLCRPPLRVRHPRLSLPHPRLAERAFVLFPLLEISSALPAAQRRELQAGAACAAGQRIERLGCVTELYPEAVRTAPMKGTA
jgi:2-amino-4-hydroxy-6-hydroxymethyldihydropteridine diphosphokinase